MTNSKLTMRYDHIMNYYKDDSNITVTELCPPPHKESAYIMMSNEKYVVLKHIGFRYDPASILPLVGERTQLAEDLWYTETCLDNSLEDISTRFKHDDFFKKSLELKVTRLNDVVIYDFDGKILIHGLDNTLLETFLAVTKQDSLGSDYHLLLDSRDEVLEAIEKYRYVTPVDKIKVRNHNTIYHIRISGFVTYMMSGITLHVNDKNELFLNGKMAS